MKKRLEESRDPMKGIFWVVGNPDLPDPKIIYLDIPSDFSSGNSKNGLTYTHERTWKDLVSQSPRDIKSKAWNYYPRGRVELRAQSATVYLNPHIDTLYCREVIIKTFNLQTLRVRFIPDGSSHYRCHLD